MNQEQRQNDASRSSGRVRVWIILLAPFLVLFVLIVLLLLLRR
jgi:hypothetical protein